MIDKSDIKRHLDSNHTDIITFHAENMNMGNQSHLVDIVHQCFEDLASQWIRSRNGDNIVDNQMCWVLMPSGDIEMMQFNNYIKLGGLENYWQDLEGNDHALDGTKFITIDKPELQK